MTTSSNKIKIRSVWLIIDPSLRVWQWERGEFDSIGAAEHPVGIDEIITIVEKIRHTCNPKPGQHFMIYIMRSSNHELNHQYISSLTPVKRIVWSEPKVVFEIREMWEI